MSLLHATKPARRFSPPALFRPSSVTVIGADKPVGRQVMRNLLAGGFGGAILPIARERVAVAGVLAYPDVASLPFAPDLALIASETGAVRSDAAALAARGTFAGIVLTMAQDVAEAARATGVRLLGPSSFGLAVPALGLDASLGHLPPRPGRLALVSQSAALCRAVLDWAEPNGVGFSHIVGVGDHADLGFHAVLDWLAQDPGTGAVLLDIRLIRDARAFLSAARAAARLRPVIAIRAGGRLLEAAASTELAWEAALRRAGVLSVTQFDDFLAAAETLTRAKPVHRDDLAIVTNAIGPGLLAADAALREGLTLVHHAPEIGEQLRAVLPGPFPTDAGEPIYVGADKPARLAEAVSRMGREPGVGGVLAVHAPAGREDEAAIAALGVAAAAMQAPLLVCAMGESTGRLHRAKLADAGVPAFETPEQAVRGFLHLVHDRRNRAAARELPSSAVLALSPDQDTVGRLFAAARGEGRLALTPGESLRVLAAYGVPTGAAPSSSDELLIRVADVATFGPTLVVARAGPAPERVRDLAMDLPPLNLSLASSMIARADVAETFPASLERSRAAIDRLAEPLVRVSQLIVDFPEIEALTILPLLADAAGVRAGRASLDLRGTADGPSRLAIAPYPSELEEVWQAGDTAFCIRPIRPEDAEQHGRFFSRLSPQDVRFRFFSAMRELPPEQLARMTQIDYDREMAFVAIQIVTGETVGAARLVCDGERRSGEFAVVVQPDMKGRGLGSRLMQRLIEWARARGVGEVIGQVLADNATMLAFVRHLHFAVRRVLGEESVLEARLRLDAPG